MYWTTAAELWVSQLSASTAHLNNQVTELLLQSGYAERVPDPSQQTDGVCKLSQFRFHFLVAIDSADSKTTNYDSGFMLQGSRCCKTFSPFFLSWGYPVSWYRLFQLSEM